MVEFFNGILQMVNKGGRPRKTGGGKQTGTHWKQITEPKSKHHYEISSRGDVRRKLKSGEYYNLKSWVTGGPYAAVYLTGIEGATRNRKKVYVHRLVAMHFKKDSKKKGNVVHHVVGPHSNTKDTLQWVTPSQNNKARKFFTDDGQRKSKLAKKKQKVEVSAPPQKKEIKPLKVPEKASDKPIQAKPPPKKRLPDDPDQFYAISEIKDIINYLLKVWRPFQVVWVKFRKSVPSVNRKNLAQKFREATGKTLKLGKSPESWNTRLTSALYEIERRLEV